MAYDPSEQDVVLQVFMDMLRSSTKDGGTKRARGEKPPWWRDPSHEAALFSHLNKWKQGERKDKDSGVHPLVHMAWRALAIAYQETNGQVDPAAGEMWCPFHQKTAVCKNPGCYPYPPHCAKCGATLEPFSAS